MNDAACGLARYLKTFSVNQGCFVALCFSKSVWAIISALAVLKTGAAYAWIDISTTREQRKKLIAKLGAVAVLVDNEIAPMFESLCSNIIPIDKDRYSYWSSHPLVAESDVQPSDPAFNLFTSGSSGEPKGAVIQHFVMVSSSEAHGRALGVGPHSRVYQFAAYTFDVATADIFTTLMHGGCVCIPSEAERLDDLAASMNSLMVN